MLFELLFTNELNWDRVGAFIPSQNFREDSVSSVNRSRIFKSSQNYLSHLRSSKMLRLARVRQNIVVSRRLTTALQQQNADSEYSEVAQYPPIWDDAYKAKKNRKKMQWRDKIKKIGTIEEKLIEINMPKYYGYKCLMLDEKTFPYNTLPFFQYVTNTELVEMETFTPKTEDDAKKVEIFLNLIKSDIEDAFEFELDGYK